MIVRMETSSVSEVCCRDRRMRCKLQRQSEWRKWDVVAWFDRRGAEVAEL